MTVATYFVTDRVRTAYYVYFSHLAESTLPMCGINVILGLYSAGGRGSSHSHSRARGVEGKGMVELSPHPALCDGDRCGG